MPLTLTEADFLSTDSSNSSNDDLADSAPVQEAGVSSDARSIGALPPEFIKSEITLHTIFFLMAAAILLMSILMRSEGEKSVFLPGFKMPMPETCSSKRIFGVDCPGCGLTRSFISISHGDVGRAWDLNKASFVVYAFVAIQLPWHALQIWRLRRTGRPIDLPGIYLAPILVVVVLMIHWIGRMASAW